MTFNITKVKSCLVLSYCLIIGFQIPELMYPPQTAHILDTNSAPHSLGFCHRTQL